MPRTFPAVRFTQHGCRMYSTVVPGGWLCDHVVVDLFDPAVSTRGMIRGYQRRPEMARAKKLAKFLERNSSVLPGSVLLNVRRRGQLGWRSTPSHREASSEPGQLTIPDGVTVYLVDGQHRQEGLRIGQINEPRLREFPIACVLMEGFSDEEEALQFYLLNSKAKKVRTDLVGRLLIGWGLVREIEAPDPAVLKATQVAILLGGEMASPWYRRIRPPNADRLPEHVASERSFIPSLAYVFNNPKLGRKSPRAVAKLLADYWEGIRTIFPNEFANPKGYLIQRTAGFYALHMLAPTIINRLQRTRTGVTAASVSRLLSGWNRLADDFWARTNPRGARRFGTGYSGFQALATYLEGRAGLN